MYDFVIVGAGPAGCVLASRLSEDTASRVLLLEAGPPDRRMEIRVPAAFPKLFKSEIDWNYTTEPEPGHGGRRLYWPRGKVLGGSSSMNAMIYTRGDPADYDEWAALGNPGWSWGDVLPYFRRAERCERGTAEHGGASGPLRVSEQRDPNPMTRAFVAAAEQAGIRRTADVNGLRQDGVDFARVMQRRGARWSAADAYLRPARRRANLRVVTGAHVSRILVRDRRATGVEYRVADRMETALARREVIVAAGAVNSPQLLMLSGIGPVDHLRDLGIDVVHDLTGVGRNLQDHLMSGFVHRATRPVSLIAAESKVSLLRYLLMRRGPLTSNVGEAVAFMRSTPDGQAPDYEIIFAPVVFMDHCLEPPTCHGLSIGAILLRPSSRGWITLASADPFTPPKIQPNYLSDADGADLRILLLGLQQAQRISRMPALAPFIGEPLEPPSATLNDDALEAHVREHAETLYHPVGTCRMGPDRNAVVDAELRVHGIEGLRVVDASVMPTIIRGHTQAPTVMIAEKAANLIRGAPRETSIATVPEDVRHEICPGGG